MGTAGTVAVTVTGTDAAAGAIAAQPLTLTKAITATSADLNGTTFIVENNTIDTLTVTKVGNTVTIRLANTTATLNSKAAIDAAIAALGGEFVGVTVTNPGGVPAVAGFLATTIANGTQTMTNAVSSVAAIVGVHTFTLNREMTAGQVLTVTYNNVAYNFVAGTEILLLELLLLHRQLTLLQQLIIMQVH